MTLTHSNGLSIEQVQAMVRRELSTPTRVVYLLLMMAALLGAGLLGTLWLTEPGPLPVRTHIAFASLVAINLAWSALFGWVVTCRKVLFAMHDVIAGWMAVVFCSIFLAAGLTITVLKTNPTAIAAIVVVGGVQLAVAVAVLTRARKRRRQLLSRRDELASMLAEHRVH